MAQDDSTIRWGTPEPVPAPREVALGPLGFLWTPLLVGLVFALAAAATGVRSRLWPPAALLAAWGGALLAGVGPAERLFDAVTVGPLAEAGTYTLALGLAGALNVAIGINPEPGRGRGPDLR